MATAATINYGLKKRELFREPILEIGSLVTEHYTQFVPRAIHNKDEEYIGIDLVEGTGVDKVLNLCHAEEMPPEWILKGGHFNTIHSHCVMEHVTDIFGMAKNIDHITRLDGALFITVPFVWRIHRIPVDMWRFTPQSIDFLFPNFEFLKGNCRISLREDVTFDIDDFPELGLASGLDKLNPILRNSIKILRRLKLDNGYFRNRALLPEMNLMMIGIKRDKPTYTFIDPSRL